MEIVESTVFIDFEDQLDAIDTALADGPGNDEAPEAFLKRIKDLLDSTCKAFAKITPEDVDDEYLEDED